MKEMKNIDELFRSSLEGHATLPPPAVKRRIEATIMRTIGFGGGFTLLTAGTLLLAGTLLAGVTAAVCFSVNQDDNGNKSTKEVQDVQDFSSADAHPITTKFYNAEISEEQKGAIAEPRILNGELANVEQEVIANDETETESRNTLKSIIKSGKEEKQKAIATKEKQTTIGALQPDKKATKNPVNSTIQTTATPIELSAKKASTRMENSLFASSVPRSGFAAQKPEDLLMSSLPFELVHGKREPVTLKDPEDFFMPKSPRQHSRWSLQTNINSGHTSGILPREEAGISQLERDPLNTRGISGTGQYHFSPRWSVGLGIGHQSVRASITSAYEEETFETEIVIIDGVETTIVNTVSVPKKEQESLRFSYLSIPIGVVRSFYLNERVSIDGSVGVEMWILNFSRGKYRLSPDRKIDLSIPDNTADILVQRPLFLSTGAAFNYRFYHRMNMLAGVKSMTSLNQKTTYGSKTYPTGYLFHLGFGYRF